MSIQTESAMYSHRFSEIEGLQKARTLSYYAYPRPNGVALCVEVETDNGKRSETCICPNLSSTYARNLLKLAYENSFGLGTWLDMLEDHGIPFKMINHI